MASFQKGNTLVHIISRTCSCTVTFPCHYLAVHPACRGACSLTAGRMSVAAQPRPHSHPVPCSARWASCLFHSHSGSFLNPRVFVVLPTKSRCGCLPRSLPLSCTSLSVPHFCSSAGSFKRFLLPNLLRMAQKKKKK